MTNFPEGISPLIGPDEEGTYGDDLALAYKKNEKPISITRPVSPHVDIQTAVIDDVVEGVTKIVPLPPRSRHVEAAKISA